MRRLLAILVALSLLAPAQPTAAANELHVIVRTGLGGMVRAGTWTPVDITLTNAGPALNGTVELAVPSRSLSRNGSFPNATIDYSFPLSVGQHSSKQFSTAIFIPSPYSHLQVSVISGARSLFSQSITFPVASPQIACGVLSSNPTSFGSLAGLAIGDVRQPRVVPLGLSDLPTNPQLLGALDCLILSDETTRSLTPAQQTALSTWVDNGGDLMIGTGGTGSSTTEGLPSDLLPARVDGTAVLNSLQSLADYVGGSVDSSGPWLIAHLSVGNGVAVVFDESRPLLVVGRRGKGAVFMLALSLTQSPLHGWNGLEHLWSYMLSYVPVSSATFATRPRQDTGWGLAPSAALIQGGAAADPAGLSFFAALLLIALVVGPINSLVLARLGRRELVLLTIPLLGGLGTAEAAYFAMQHQLSDVVLNQVSIVRTWDGRGSGETHTFVGTYALYPQTAQLEIPANVLLTNSLLAIAGLTPPGLPPVRMVENGAPEVQGLDLDANTMRIFSLDGQVDNPGQVQSSLVLHGDRITGQVVNNLGETLHDATFVGGAAVEPLGDLAPGTSHSISLRVGPSAPVGFRDPAQIIDRLFPGQSILPSESHDLPYAILSAALNPAQGGAGQLNLNGVSLIGWTDGFVSPVKNSVTRQQARQSTLFVTNLSLQLPSDPTTIPAQLLERQLLTTSSSAQIDANGLTVSAGDVVDFLYQVPVDPPHFALRSLALATAANTPMAGTLQFYDWRSGGWDQVPYFLGVSHVPHPERYVSATGGIRVRFTSAARGPGSPTFTRFQLEVEGTQ